MNSTVTPKDLLDWLRRNGYEVVITYARDGRPVASIFGDRVGLLKPEVKSLFAHYNGAIVALLQEHTAPPAQPFASLSLPQAEGREKRRLRRLSGALRDLQRRYRDLDQCGCDEPNCLKCAAFGYLQDACDEFGALCDA